MKIVTKEEVQLNNPNSVIPDEEFREIEGFDGWYYVSNYGNVVSLHDRAGHEPYKSLHSNKQGYYAVTLSRNGKDRPFLVHRLVAKAFIPEIEGKPEVNHKDCNKHNCYVGNLEWCTQAENVQHAVKMKVTKFNTAPMLAKGRATCFASVSKPVLVVEQGVMYSSATACGKAIGFPWWYVSRAIRDSDGYGSKAKLHFKYVTQDEYTAWLSGELEVLPKQYDDIHYLNKGATHRSRCVRIVETGECFSSSAECDKALNTTPRVTSRIINTCNGYYPKLDIRLEYISEEEYVAWKANPEVKEHKPILDVQSNLKLQRSRYCVKIVETGECFISSKVCDELKGFRKNYTSSTITRCGGHRKNSPYHFVKISAEEYLEYVRSQSNK